MHRPCLMAAALALSLGMLCSPAYAESNVLVPQDDDAPAPAAEAPPSIDVPSLGSESKSDSEDAALPQLDPDFASPAPPPQFTPVPINILRQGTAAAGMPAGGTRVVKMPVPEPPNPNDNNDKPGKLTIDINPHSQLGYSDASSVQKILGIPAGAVPQHCRLGGSGMMHSNAAPGMFLFDLGLAGRAVVHYDGIPTNLSMSLRALCDLVALPASTHSVMQVGDKYSLYLSSVNCPPPPPNVYHLSIQYAGDGNGKCLYH